MARLPETIQTDIALLQQLSQAGIHPGAVVTIQPVEDAVRVRAEGQDHSLDLDGTVSSHLILKRGA